jgi:hypothetical protein
MPATRPLEERFWEKVNKCGRQMPHMKTCCWEWTASKSGGYGYIGFTGKLVHATHASWKIHFGKWPKGVCVLHHCDNPGCVNPSHLYLGTQRQNAADRKARGREVHQSGDTHWARKHPEWLKHGDEHWTRKARPWRGEKNCKAKLTRALAAKIRVEYATGKYFYKDLAVKYDVDSTTIGNIVRKESWV